MTKKTITVRQAVLTTLALLPVLFIFFLSSCSTPKNIAYMQDTNNGTEEAILHPMPIKFQPGDKLQIIVKSKDPELSNLFNLPTVSYRIGQGKTTSLYNSNSNVLSYTIDDDGNIDFPVLGQIHIAGMSRDEISNMIKDKLVGSKMVKDPVVLVDFDNLAYSVLGEVKSPGRFSIDRDKVTIYDAIAKAGDLTIYGNRQNVKVQRRVGDELKVYTVDLTSSKSSAQSPAYYLQQNDMVYVEPNTTRQRQSTVNGNNLRSTSFWISIASLAATVATIIISASN